MNADGSPGVHADISAGADLPFVGAVATALIIGGLGGIAHRRRACSPSASSPPAAGARRAAR